MDSNSKKNQLRKFSLEKIIPLTYQAFKLGCLNLCVCCFEGQILNYYFDWPIRFLT